MSAGIIVMNKNAIAMAADSAVTIGDHAAIHNSANKLFALSKFKPVGAIIYSNAQFMSIPMEIIIKQYKAELGNKSFPLLADYVQDFISFLENHRALFRFDINECVLVKSIYVNLLNGLKNGYQKEIEEKIKKKKKKLTDTEMLSIAKSALKETETFILNHNKIQDSFTSYIKNKYFGDISAYITANFSWISGDDAARLTEEICGLFDTGFYRNGYVGVAIAGYGDEEIFPHMVHMHFSGIINGKLRYMKLEPEDIDEQNTASIIPLAQTDVMDTFIRGYNRSVYNKTMSLIQKSLKNRLDGVPETIVSKDARKAVNASLAGVENDIIQELDEFSGGSFVGPIIQSVETLPIEELALFAESMINITSVRRRVALDGNIGTVGGPIDVAIVTQGDGFIWLKRKHYFDAKMNPQFICSRYFQNDLEGKADEE